MCLSLYVKTYPSSEVSRCRGFTCRIRIEDVEGRLRNILLPLYALEGSVFRKVFDTVPIYNNCPPAGVDLESWREQFDTSSRSGKLEEIADHLTSSALPNSIIVDCTASEAPAALYEWWMRQGIHVVTPNKKLGAGPLQRYHTVRNLARRAYTHWFYEVCTTTRLRIACLMSSSCHSATQLTFLWSMDMCCLRRPLGLGCLS